MKLGLFLIFLIPVNLMAQDTLLDLQAKHRRAYHEENRKWGEMEIECRTKYKKSYDVRSPDYDQGFECREKIQDLKNQFQRKQAQEVCEKFNACIKY